MSNLPEPSKHKIYQNPILALRIWEEVVNSMTQYTNDSVSSKFMPAEELLVFIRPVAAAFALMHFTPMPPVKEIYKSHLYSLFYFSIICGIQVYLKERNLIKGYAPFSFVTDTASLIQAKHKIMKQLTDGIQVLPPVNQTMDILLSHLITPRRLLRIPLKNTEFDSAKFDKFMPVTILWGYLFAKEIVSEN